VRCARAVLEGVRSRLDRRKAEPSLPVGDLDAVALEAGIDGCGVRVGGVAVAAGGVGLPELDARAPQGLARLLEDAPRHVNDLPLGARAVRNSAAAHSKRMRHARAAREPLPKSNAPPAAIAC